ncbi:hypothetical protein ACVWYQ_003384 [Bradyrhizobium sp. USDA 3397]
MPLTCRSTAVSSFVCGQHIVFGWRSNGAPSDHRPLTLPILTRRRLILSLRAVDGSLEGHSYREIAQGLFGKHRIPDRTWKTHDLRSRTIRLVKTGLHLVRGGYRALLRRKRKGEDDPS